MPASRAAAGNGQGSGDGGDPARIPVHRRTRHTASAAGSRATRPVPCTEVANASHHHARSGAQDECRGAYDASHTVHLLCTIVAAKCRTPVLAAEHKRRHDSSGVPRGRLIQ